MTPPSVHSKVHATGPAAWPDGLFVAAPGHREVHRSARLISIDGSAKDSGLVVEEIWRSSTRHFAALSSPSHRRGIAQVGCDAAGLEGSAA